ncbi:MAG: rod shape-determining protein RodA [Syntrophales bacterium]
MKFDRQLFFHFDWVLLILVLVLMSIGLLNLYSAGYSLDDYGQSSPYIKQVQWILIGLLFMGVVICIDYRFLNSYAYVIHAFSVFLLVCVFLYGNAIHGSQRWIVVGGGSFQPSELVKLTMILALAKYFDDYRADRSYILRELLIPILIVAIPFLLILKQPDLGTALILGIIFLSVVLFVGIDWRPLVFTAVGFVAFIPVGWHFLKDYQKGRVITFFSPESDPLGSGYHIIQSIIAVGSGGILGKGFLKGTQTQLKFLPVQQTDFVFSVFAEEWGFLGAMILIIIFLSLIYWCLKISFHAKDLVGALISFGIAMLIFWQVFINIGMILGIVPVVGIPLPFMSYGGSSMVVLLTAIGMLINISMRRFILRP